MFSGIVFYELERDQVNTFNRTSLYFFISRDSYTEASLLRNNNLRK